MPMLIFMDGNLDRNIEYAETYGLNFPILSDIEYEIFDRWNPTRVTPSTTFISRGSIVHSTEQVWYPELIDDVVNGE